MLHLDTNVAVALMNKSSRLVADSFEQATAREPIGVSAVVLFELRFGVANSARQNENQRKLELFLQTPVVVLPFELNDALEAGLIRADLRRKGTPIGPYDLLIAAQARRRGATLVTANTREFARVPGLALRDWTTAA